MPDPVVAIDYKLWEQRRRPLDPINVVDCEPGHPKASVAATDWIEETKMPPVCQLFTFVA